MAEKVRSVGAGDKGVETAPVEEVGAGSGEAAPGGARAYVNDRGEICFGNACFNLAVDQERKEIRVTINRDECAPELQETLDELHHIIGRGGNTVYETKSTQR